MTQNSASTHQLRLERDTAFAERDELAERYYAETARYRAALEGVMECCTDMRPHAAIYRLAERALNSSSVPSESGSNPPRNPGEEKP